MSLVPSKADIAALRARWSKTATNRINRALAKGTVHTLDLPKFTVEGMDYIDLRGLHFTHKISEMAMSGIDMSYCTVPTGTWQHGAICDVDLTNCRFLQSNFAETSIWVRASKCDFTGGGFSQLAGSFEDCSFARSKITGSGIVDTNFTRCDFSEANWTNASLVDCIFRDCEWNTCKLGRGIFGRSRFIRTWPTPQMLGATFIEDVIFEDASGNESVSA